jgi:hypothetical protein
MTAAFDDEFYLWQPGNLSGDAGRLLRPTLSQDFHHFIIAIFLLLQLKMERTLNQLSLMVQQPLTADHNRTVITAVEARYRDVQRILVVPSGCEATTQPGSWLPRFATSVLRSC